MSQQLAPKIHVDAVNDVVNVDTASINHRDLIIPAGATIHSISADIQGSNVGTIGSNHALRVDYSFIVRGIIIKSGYKWIVNFEKSSNDARQARNSLFDILNLKVPYGWGDITLRAMVDNASIGGAGINVNVFCPYTAVNY